MIMFRTSLAFNSAPFSIQYQEKILTLGSCFAQNIGNKLDQLNYQIINNPFGVVYNPLSLAKGLDYIVNTAATFENNDLQQQNGLWHSWYHHSIFSGEDPQEVLARMNKTLEIAQNHFRESQYLLLTLGTAWVYELLDTGEVVSNCHKYPKSYFRRRRLTVEEIVKRLAALFESFVQQQNCQVVLTVSPIRHLKDGAVENQISKATLLLAVHQLVERFEQVHYFPAYELMMDELRDYRFYADDMLHPSSVAVDYIWSKFEQYYLDPKQATWRKRLAKLHKATLHKPFNPNSTQHQLFIKKQLEQINYLQKEMPWLNFAKFEQGLK
ncbi:MAG: GSCFA domain-containing protein [Saprospiraceae bacterium]|nr:GSCFA domain-containing protein [Saprospiraceae bacterium]